MHTSFVIKATIHLTYVAAGYSTMEVNIASTIYLN